ncbi:MAG: hypothetical protein U9R49_00340 [Bacteroidota bacterium]|nr:hypothetical protein [Bacteroidota bacterium]
MRRGSIALILFLFLMAGCEKDKDLADRLLRSSVELTDGYCLVHDDQVVLNHHDIEHYDYGTHLIYLKDHISTGELLEEAGNFTVYAGGEEIYTIGTQPGYSSYAPVGPFIWTHPTFYADNIIAIHYLYPYEVLEGNTADPREDPWIIEALEKYGQFYEGLQCEISSIWFSSPDHLALNLKLTNLDPVNYYYLDPEKMGMGLFHYFTNGLTLQHVETEQSYTNNVEHQEPNQWDSFDMEWMTLLEGNSSVNLTLRYNNFEQAPEGSYQARFMFPGLQFQVEHDDLAQQHGQIWLGQLCVYKEVVISHDLF